MSADKASKTTKPADRTPAEDRSYLRRRRILGLVSLAVVLALAGVVTYFVCTDLLGKIRSPEEFRAYIESLRLDRTAGVSRSAVPAGYRCDDSG